MVQNELPQSAHHCVAAVLFGFAVSVFLRVPVLKHCETFTSLLLIEHPLVFGQHFCDSSNSVDCVVSNIDIVGSLAGEVQELVEQGARAISA